MPTVRYPIPRQELESYRVSLCNWQAPIQFEACVDKLFGRLNAKGGAVQFFNDSHMKFLHEAWVASKVARARLADAVMLVPQSERWPDFRLRWADAVCQYEITTADKEGRCVGQEYKTKGAPSFHDWEADLAQVPSAIERAAQLKAAKSYSEAVALVIYSLIGDYDWSGDYGRDKVESAMHEAVPCEG